MKIEEYFANVPFIRLGREFHEQKAEFARLKFTGIVINGRPTPANDQEKEMLAAHELALWQCSPTRRKSDVRVLTQILYRWLTIQIIHHATSA